MESRNAKQQNMQQQIRNGKTRNNKSGTVKRGTTSLVRLNADYLHLNFNIFQCKSNRIHSFTPVEGFSKRYCYWQGNYVSHNALFEFVYILFIHNLNCHQLHICYLYFEMLYVSYIINILHTLYIIVYFQQKSFLQQLAEARILSKTVLSNANKMEINGFQKVLKSAASFVTYSFCHTNDVINLKWQPITERINYYHIKLALKATYEKTFPNYLKLTLKNRNERFRKIKNDEFRPLKCKDNTFYGSVSTIFNELPKNIRSEMKCRIFSKLIKQ